ncbi:hypothetical protein ACWGJT_27335 [Streptomyces xantholiticus]
MIADGAQPLGGGVVGGQDAGVAPEPVQPRRVGEFEDPGGDVERGLRHDRLGSGDEGGDGCRVLGVGVRSGVQGLGHRVRRTVDYGGGGLRGRCQFAVGEEEVRVRAGQS